MLVRLHAARVHASQLHRLRIRTPHGQRHGEITAAALDANAIPKLRLIDSLVSPQVKTGFVMNILGILSVTLAVNTWGVAMFDLHTYPEWAHPPNNSAAAVVQALNATLWSLTEKKGPRSVWRLVTERGLQSVGRRQHRVALGASAFTCCDAFHKFLYSSVFFRLSSVKISFRTSCVIYCFLKQDQRKDLTSTQ